jgi:hypothetical protein
MSSDRKALTEAKATELANAILDAFKEADCSGVEALGVLATLIANILYHGKSHPDDFAKVLRQAYKHRCAVRN